MILNVDFTGLHIAWGLKIVFLGTEIGRIHPGEDSSISLPIQLLLRQQEQEQCRPWYKENLAIHLYDSSSDSGAAPKRTTYDKLKSAVKGLSSSANNFGAKFGEIRVPLHNAKNMTDSSDYEEEGEENGGHKSSGNGSFYEEEDDVDDSEEGRYYDIVDNKLDDAHNRREKKKFRLYIEMSIEDTSTHQNKEASFIPVPSPRLKYLTMGEMYPSDCPYFQHLYLQLPSNGQLPSSTNKTTLVLPFPNKGEIILDMKEEVQWRVSAGLNFFGDVIYVLCVGALVITELRIVFLPFYINCSFWHHGPIYVPHRVVGGSHRNKRTPPTNISEDTLATIKKFTYQMPLGNLYDVSHSTASPSSLRQSFKSSGGAEEHDEVGGHRYSTFSNRGSNVSDAPDANISCMESFLMSADYDYAECRRDEEMQYFDGQKEIDIDVFSGLICRPNDIGENRGRNLRIMGKDGNTTEFYIPSCLLDESSEFFKSKTNQSVWHKMRQRPASERLQINIDDSDDENDDDEREEENKLVEDVSRKDDTDGDSNDKILWRHTLYTTGLLTASVLPSTWCTRVSMIALYYSAQEITFRTFAKNLKSQIDAYRGLAMTMAGNSKEEIDRYLKGITMPFSFDSDYMRQNVIEYGWRQSDINMDYQLCDTYPSSLYFPATCDDESIFKAAEQRSRGRVPALVWIHPETKASLCRSAQPLSGMVNTKNIEDDKQLCLAIRNTSNVFLPEDQKRSLRIADARPKLNANANALQGKGFENVNSWGAGVARICFMDIENIHVMRGSLNRLKTGLLNGMCGHNGWDPKEVADDNRMDTEVMSQSSWKVHLSLLLKGASSIAESLMLSHPVLVHCSDGWDRTAQLSSLAQILLDPYYRTIDGLITLIEKDWCSFGYKFHDRTQMQSRRWLSIGKTRDNRGIPVETETSPVFLQFLDCVFQLTQQFPHSFEFTSHFLVVLSQAVQSGLFASLLYNCESQRRNEMRENARFADLSLIDLQAYSSIATYMRLLASIYIQMKNPHYRKTRHRDSKVAFLRPHATGPHDLELWREGLIGFLDPSLNILQDPTSMFLSNGANLNENVENYVQFDLLEEIIENVLSTKMRESDSLVLLNR